MASHTRLKPQQHTLQDIRNASQKYKYVFITTLEKFYFPFQTYQPGVYYITEQQGVYAIKEPTFLFVNGLTLRDT